QQPAMVKPDVILASPEQLTYQEQIIEAAGKVNKTVVSIITSSKEGAQGKLVDVGLGSGIIFKQEKAKAYIVTNDHVVQKINDIEVVLYDGSRRKAKLVGSDALADLAILEM